MTDQDAQEITPSWNDVLELATACDQIIRSTAMGAATINISGKGDRGKIEKVTTLLQQEKRKLEEVLSAVPTTHQDVKEKEHPLYLDLFSKLDVCRTSLMNYALPLLTELTAETLNSVEGAGVDLSDVVLGENGETVESK